MSMDIKKIAKLLRMVMMKMSRLLGEGITQREVIGKKKLYILR